MPRVVKVLEPADRGAAVARDTLLLTYSQRAMQHGFAFGAKGTCVELDFAEPTVLETDDVLMLDDLTAVDVVAEAEPVVEVRPHDAAALARLAWTLGDRHVPAQIFSNRLRVLRSPENDAMVADYGRTTVLIAPFEPDHAPAHGHDHRHHDHPHGHAHAHDHDHHGHAGHDHAGHDDGHVHHDHGHDDHAVTTTLITAPMGTARARIDRPPSCHGGLNPASRSGDQAKGNGRPGDTPMTPQLLEIINDAYRLFAAYRPGRAITSLYPSRKLDPEIERVLLTTPLRRIPREALAAYTDHACPFGPLDRWWPYFVPRGLELIASYQWPSTLGAEGALQFLYRDFRTCLPADEAATIDRYLLEFLRSFVCEKVHGINRQLLWVCGCKTGDARAFDVLVMLTRVGTPMRRLLTQWDETEGAVPDMHLAGLVNTVFGRDEDRTGPQALPQPERTILRNWLLSPPVRRRVELAFYTGRGELVQAMFSAAEHRLREAMAAAHDGPG